MNTFVMISGNFIFEIDIIISFKRFFFGAPPKITNKFLEVL